jgi:hypothetical protein
MKAIKINKFIFSIVFNRLFNKGNRKHFFRVPIECIETVVKVWEKLLPNFHACFYNSIETRKMFSIS